MKDHLFEVSSFRLFGLLLAEKRWMQQLIVASAFADAAVERNVAALIEEVESGNDGVPSRLEREVVRFESRGFAKTWLVCKDLNERSDACEWETNDRLKLEYYSSPDVWVRLLQT